MTASMVFYLLAVGLSIGGVLGFLFADLRNESDDNHLAELEADKAELLDSPSLKRDD